MEDEIKKLVSVNSWFISLQVVTLIAFLGGAGFLYSDFQLLRRQVESAVRGAPQEVSNWEEYVRPYNASIGDSSAPIIIVEYTDFQCPFCKAFNEGLREELLSNYGDRVRMVFKNFPLERLHPEAQMAAIAAQCALREGKFWEIKDVLFNNPNFLSAQFVIQEGASLGLGPDYANCVINEETLAEVEQDMRDGESARIQGTPTFVINGKVMNGARSLSQFAAVIEELN